MKRLAWDCRLITKMWIHLISYASNSLFTYKMPLAVTFGAQTLSRDLPLLFLHLLLSSDSCFWPLPELCCRCAGAQSCISLILMLTQTCPVTTGMPDSLGSVQNRVTIAGSALYALLGSCETAPLSLGVQACLPCCDFGLLPHFSLPNSLPLLVLEILFLFVDGCI